MKKYFKLMFKERGKKKYYNFSPTIDATAKPKYNKIDSMRKARSIKRELKRDWKTRTWKIKRK